MEQKHDLLGNMSKGRKGGFEQLGTDSKITVATAPRKEHIM